MSEFVFSRKPIEIDHGEGVTLYDTNGTAYLDAGASYACTPVGHCHPTVVDAVKEQAETLLYVQGSYPTASRDALVERLASLGPTGCTNVWLCNSGTEANEAALKFARSATSNTKIVAAMRGFHGRTMGALSATWKAKYREPFEPLVEPVEFVPYNDEEALAEAIDAETAAVILEPIQGEGGVHPGTEAFLQTAREQTESVGAALIFDEIQTGIGRTGTFWAAEQYGISPDIVTSAKGIASGLPLGTVLCQDWIAADAGPHGSTFSGNPLVAAAATATLSVIDDEGLADQAATVGSNIREQLRAADLPIRAVRGRGLLIGIQLKQSSSSVLRDLALNEQVLALPAGRSVLRLLPPLITTEAQATELVGSIEAVLSEANG